MLIYINSTTNPYFVKAQLLRPPDVNFADLQVGTLSQCFSCLQLSPFESDCKDTHFFQYSMFFVDRCFFSWCGGDSFYLLCRFFCLSLHCILWPWVEALEPNNKAVFDSHDVR